MQSTTTLELNLQYPNHATTMYAVQNDRLSRKISAVLADGATAWTPPSGTVAIVRYVKPDGTMGFYDTDENDDPAVTWTGNVATITLAEQVLTVPGNVWCQVNFYNAGEERLSTFKWVIKVQENVITDETIESTDYFNILTHQIDEIIEAITDMPIPSTSDPLMDGTASPGSAPGFARGDHVHPSDTSRVPTTRKVNNKALSSDITLSASDVGAVPTTREVNGKALSSDITLDAEDVGAVPTTRTVNGEELSSDVTLNASDIPNDSIVSGENVDDALDNLGYSANANADILNTIYHDSLKGKKISIIGDSISTYDQAGYKIDGYAMYYPDSSIAGIADVDSVDKTWWKQILNLTGAKIEVNASYSGSCVTNVLSGQGYPDFYDRCTSAILGNPDIIIVALGTNDSSQAVPIGDFDYTTAYTSLDESTFSNAYIKGIKALQANLPNAQIICVSMYMNPWYVNATRLIAAQFGLTYIDANPYQGGSGPHPASLGMKQIALNVLSIRGAQTNINGTRTSVNGLVCFGQHIVLYGNMDASKAPASNTGLPYIAFRDYNNKYLSTIRGWKYADGSGFMRFSGNNILPDNSEFGNALDVGALVDGKPFIRVACDYGSNSTKKVLNAKHAWQKTLLTPDEVSITQTSPLPTGVSAISNLNVIQSGYVVEICCLLTLSASLGSWTTLATGLPKPKPNTTMYFTPQISYNSTINAVESKPIQMRLNNSGAFAIRNGYAETFGFTFTYMTGDDPEIVS